jgi:outer membrane protein, multidrug efflux system
VVNNMSKVENYGRSVAIKRLQRTALEKAVVAATSLYQLPRADTAVDYLDVLTAQNELFTAIRDLIDTKGEQLAAIVNSYQALGGGGYLFPFIPPQPPQVRHWWHHLRHSEAIEVAANDPGPPPPSPVAAEMGPGPLSTPAAAGMGPEPPPAPTPGRGQNPLPAPGTGGLPEPLTAPAAVEGAPELLPVPAATERVQIPPPRPVGGGYGSVGDGKGSATGSNE